MATTDTWGELIVQPNDTPPPAPRPEPNREGLTESIESLFEEFFMNYPPGPVDISALAREVLAIFEERHFELKLPDEPEAPPEPTTIERVALNGNRLLQAMVSDQVLNYSAFRFQNGDVLVGFYPHGAGYESAKDHLDNWGPERILATGERQADDYF